MEQARTFLPLKYAEGEQLTPCSQTLVMWNGTKVKPVGTCALPVVNPKNNERYRVSFLVVKEDLTPLLGLNATETMKLLTVHKENFVNVIENANDDLTVSTQTFSTKPLEFFLEKCIFKWILIVNLLFFQQENYPCP